MSAYAELRTEILAVIAQSERALKRLDEIERANAAPGVVKVYMEAEEFARRHGVKAVTVRRYAKLGMPHERLGGGRIRVHVEDAERWLKEGGARRAVEEDAEIETRRAG